MAQWQAEHRALIADLLEMCSAVGLPSRSFELCVKAALILSTLSGVRTGFTH